MHATVALALLFGGSLAQHNMCEREQGTVALEIEYKTIFGVSPIGPRKATVRGGGRPRELHYGLNGDMKVYSFVALPPVNNYSGDVKDFFNYLSSNQGFPASSQYVVGQLSIRHRAFHWWKDDFGCSALECRIGTDARIDGILNAHVWVNQYPTGRTCLSETPVMIPNDSKQRHQCTNPA